MNEMIATPRLAGTEHWTNKGDVKLFMWNKCAVDPAKAKATILFVHSPHCSPLSVARRDEGVVPRRPVEHAPTAVARELDPRSVHVQDELAQAELLERLHQRRELLASDHRRILAHCGAGAC